MNNLVVVVDSGGRQFIGKQIVVDDEIVELKDYLKYSEVPISNGMGNQAQIQLQFAPPSHIFNISNIKIKWLSISSIDDEKLISAYDKFWTEIRASRSGISVAKNMPDKRMTL